MSTYYCKHLETLLKDKKLALRIPKNPRKYNIWESTALASTMEKCMQITANFHQAIKEDDVYPSDMDNVNIPASLMFEICESYVVMYEKLLKEQLLITGNPEANHNIH